MLARVTTWQGGTADGIRAAMDEMKSRAASGPPEGVKSAGFTLLGDPESGRVLMFGLFENEDDLRSSEAALQAMDVPRDIGTRSGPEIYEVGVDIRM
jgi:hypothetical protein